MIVAQSTSEVERELYLSSRRRSEPQPARPESDPSWLQRSLEPLAITGCLELA